jgi:hypothetical protein
MCAKDTAIWPKLTHALTWPMVWKSATGRRAMMNSRERRGAGWRRETHRKSINKPLAAACKQADAMFSNEPLSKMEPAMA